MKFNRELWLDIVGSCVLEYAYGVNSGISIEKGEYRYDLEDIYENLDEIATIIDKDEVFTEMFDRIIEHNIEKYFKEVK